MSRSFHAKRENFVSIDARIFFPIGEKMLDTIVCAVKCPQTQIRFASTYSGGKTTHVRSSRPNFGVDYPRWDGSSPSGGFSLMCSFRLAPCVYPISFSDFVRFQSQTSACEIRQKLRSGRFDFSFESVHSRLAHAVRTKTKNIAVGESPGDSGIGRFDVTIS